MIWTQSQASSKKGCPARDRWTDSKRSLDALLKAVPINVITEGEFNETVTAHANAGQQTEDPTIRYPSYKAAAEMQMQNNRWDVIIAASQRG